MSPDAAAPDLGVREDGFGTRRIADDPESGRVEVLALSPELSTPAAEQAIRARAARLADLTLSGVAPVVRISRSADGLAMATAVPEGISLADVLAALEFQTVKLPDEALVELAGETVRAVAAMHAAGAVHGALSPSHVILRRGGGVALSGAAFADALQSLQFNRERLWRAFGLALPPSASLPRFDQRADVTQLGALVIAILLRRPLAAGEYPRGAADLVNAATAGWNGHAAFGSALRMWLQQVLQLHPKAMFASAVDAAHAYTAASAGVPNRRAAAQALQSMVRQLCGGDTTLDERRRPAVPVAVPAPAPVAAQVPAPVHAPLQAPVPVPSRAAGPASPLAAVPLRTFSLLRNVFPVLRAN